MYLTVILGLKIVCLLNLDSGRELPHVGMSLESSQSLFYAFT